MLNFSNFLFMWQRKHQQTGLLGRS